MPIIRATKRDADSPELRWGGSRPSGQGLVSGSLLWTVTPGPKKVLPPVNESQHLHLFLTPSIHEAEVFHDQLAPGKAEFRNSATSVGECQERCRSLFDSIQKPLCSTWRLLCEI